VWPSFWTQRVNRTWPYGGEIDIIETVNLMPSNQYALHTGNSACIASASATQSGAIVNANCSTPPGSSSAGCTISEPNKNSVGAAFAAVGGGVYATLFDTTG
ncbi:glycoside hydrolase family 16 protein, partial [Postia placenta MAD-698-R-SB12]